MNMLTVLAPQHAFRRSERGFSLVEIMVGLVIAMVAVIIMMEVLITSEQRTRTTNAGNDAMSTGAVMMHMMQRDLIQAGYGINSMGLLGCNLKLPAGTTTVPVPLAPVSINPALAGLPAADANTDVLLVLYGNDSGQPEGNAITAVAANDYTVQAPSAFNVNDYVIAYPGTCPAGGLTLAQVTAFPPGGLAVTVNFVEPGANTLYDMGQAPKVVGYMVRSGSLASCDFLASDCTQAVNWQAVAGNIVSLRAQYGRDTAPAGSMDGIVDAWDQTTPTTACTWARASAVRFGLLARSAQYETKIDTATGQRTCDPVTAATPTWTGSTGTSTAPFVAPFAGSTAAEWQCYRYKTFENIAPTRNIVWMGTQAGC
jgi:type IV pilus assembly protein PilW